ncbi:MAG TPA: DUF418 domain-containing protein [Acidobacteriaceae bacterium]
MGISAFEVETRLSPGSEEELGGPPRAVAPVKRAERISSLDILRGFALLGILMLNIDNFAGPEFFHDIPIGLPKPAFTGPHAHLNLVILFLKWVFFEGKMRALFSMLFGAGVILLTSRAEKRGAGMRAADIYVRRNMWLCALGVFHGTFLWDGDILFDYGLCALLLMLPFRVLKPKTLFVAGILIAVGLGTYNVLDFTGSFDDIRLSRQVAIVAADQQAGKQITSEQKQLQQKWRAEIADKVVTKAKIDARMAAAHEGYVAHLVKHGMGYGRSGFDSFYYREIGDAMGAMLIGMALFKSGFLTAELSCAVYLWTAIVGFLISAPLYIVGIWKVYASGFSFLAVEEWAYTPYALARVAGALAIAAILLIVIKRGAFHSLLRPFAAVGHTALSNYLLTTVLCQTLFLWGPWKLYGKLEYYQYTYVVLAVWAINLIVSPIWLRAFAFGPVEWLWRSLTHWKLQPMRLRA